jgi:hypothetical protein
MRGIISTYLGEHLHGAYPIALSERGKAERNVRLRATI